MAENPVSTTVLELLERRVAEQPLTPLYLEAQSEIAGAELRVCSGRDFNTRVLKVAGSLQQHAPVGSRALICLPHGIGYLEAFFGCLYAGMVAVPVYPPHMRRSQPQLEAITRSCEPSLLITDAAHRASSEKFVASFASETHVPALRIVEFEGLHGASYRRPTIDSESLAFLQYTSGSTAEPKGVAISHGQLLANQRAIATLVGEGGVGVSWLPLFHDMGLGSALAALACGGSSLIFAPFLFATNPRLWLETISTHRARVSAAPNFAYEHCVARIGDDELVGLDLSSWKVAIVGAEPVRAQTLRSFANKFGRVGFDPRAFRPSFGMAEATLLVSGEVTARAPVSVRAKTEDLAQGKLVPCTKDEAASELVSCGRALPEHRLLIVDPQTCRVLPEQSVGEIWVAGPSVASGYWGCPEQTAATFCARTPEADGKFLRTGDLGALCDGELFVTGRLKDLLIIRGRNYYPQDIERAVAACDGKLETYASAAFSLDDQDGAQGAALVLEVSKRAPLDELPPLLVALCEQVQESCDLSLDLVAFTSRGTCPQTTSGKVRRRETRTLLIDGNLPLLAYWTRDRKPRPALADVAQVALPVASFVPPEGDDEQRVADIWADALGLAKVGRHERFFDLGGNSMHALAILQRLNAAFGVSLHYRDFYALPTVEGVARALEKARRSGASSTSHSLDSGDQNCFALTRAQRRIWDAFRANPHDTASNISASMRLTGPLDRSALIQALNTMAYRHPALRTRFIEDLEGQVWQQVESELRLVLEEHDLTAVSQDLRASERLRQLGLAMLRPFDLTLIPLFRVLLFRHDVDDYELTFVVNHIVSDGWSLSILERELHTLLALGREGREASLPGAVGTYADYVRWLDTVTSDTSRQEQLAQVWKSRLGSRLLEPAKLPYDFPTAYDATDTKTSSFRTVLSASASQRVKALAQAHGSTTFVVLLSALTRWLGAELGRDQLFLGIPSANRHEERFLGVFGYFVDPVILPLSVHPGEAFDTLIERVREEVFTSLEWSAFSIEHVCKIAGVPCPGLPMFHVWYNMTTFGDMAQRVLVDHETRHTPIGPDSKFDFSIYPSEYQNGFEINTYYKRALYRPQTIERAVLGFVRTLEELT